MVTVLEDGLADNYLERTPLKSLQTITQMSRQLWPGNRGEMIGTVAQRCVLIGWREVSGSPVGPAAFFDNRIIDADAPSYVQANLSWEATASRVASAKKKKYRLAAEEVRGSFTPLVCSTDGALHREYAAYLKRIAFCLSSKWEKPYAQVMGWVRIRTQFAIFRAVDLRLRGTRRSIQGMFLSDGAAVGVGY